MPDPDRDMATEHGEREESVTTTSGDTPCPVQHPRFPTLAETKLEKVPAGLKGPCRLKIMTSKCLKKDFPVTGGLCFQTMDDAKASMDGVQWYAPENDNTIPKTEEEHRVFVKQLVDAFKDMNTAKDTEGNAYRKRLTPGHDSYYGDWAIEACAWNIVRMAKSIHTEGFKVAIYDKTIIDSISQTQKWTFEERIDWICMALKTSKANAVNLMKYEKIWTVVGAPHKLYTSTITNAVSNKHRGLWVIHGRNADPNHQARTAKRQKTYHNAFSNTDANVGTEDVDGTKDVGDAGAVESTGGTAGTTKTALKQRKPRKSKDNIASMPAPPPIRNNNLGFLRYQPPGLPTRGLTPYYQAPPRLQEPSFWRPSEQNRDAQMIRLMLGDLPKREDKIVIDLTGAEGDTINSSEHNDILENDTAMRDNVSIKDFAASKNTAAKDNTTAKDAVDVRDTLTTEDNIVDDNMMNHHGLPVRERFNSNADTELFDSPEGLLAEPSSVVSSRVVSSSPAVSSPAATQVHVLPVPEIVAVQRPVHDAATLEGARLLASLRETH